VGSGSRSLRFDTVVSRLRVVGRLLGVSECLEVRTGSDVRVCLDAIVRKVRTLVGTEQDSLSCAVQCVEEFIGLCSRLRVLNELSRQYLSAVFTLGDSPLGIDDARQVSVQARRLVRHVAYLDGDSRSIVAVPHVARIIYVMYICEKFRKCLEKCGRDVLSLVSRFVSSIDLPEDVRGVVLDAIRELVGDSASSQRS